MKRNINASASLPRSRKDEGIWKLVRRIHLRASTKFVSKEGMSVSLKILVSRDTPACAFGGYKLLLEFSQF
jgi:hypothetical protein